MSSAGLAISSFDMFHVGHLSAVRQASELVDRLVLAVADDALVSARRGTDPLVSESERLEVLRAFFPDVTIALTSTDDGVTLVERHAVDSVFVCLPDDTAAPSTIATATVRPLRYEMTTSTSLRANLEAEILWIPA